MDITRFLKPPSDEQRRIIDLAKDHNIIVDSVAGCGKTTTILHIARTYPDRKILVLMYNRRLKEESRMRVAQIGISNVEVQNFHSFFVRHYDPTCITDSELTKCIDAKVRPNYPFKYDMIIIDEAQDMKMIFYRAFCKIFADCDIDEPQILVFGDRYQNVYKFLGSDERFLIYGERLFSMSNYPWKTVKLSVSYRLTHETARFINKCVIGYDRIQTPKSSVGFLKKHGPDVKYVICNCYTNPYKYVKKAIAKYGVANIFILSTSVKSPMTPLRKLANKLSLEGIPVFVPISDDSDIDESIIEGKLVFTTFNQTKGLERDCVFMFSIDDWNPNKTEDCPNNVYVAMTRAKQALTLFHSNRAAYAPFINADTIEDNAQIIQHGKFNPKEHDYKSSTSVSVTELTQYLSNDAMKKALSFVRFKGSIDKCRAVEIPTSVKQNNDLIEEVSDITGVAIPAYYEFQISGQMQFYKTLLEGVNNNEQRELISNLKPYNSNKTVNLVKLLKTANMYNAMLSGYIHKTVQIDRYDWIDEKQLERLVPRFRKHLRGSSLFEVPVKSPQKILGKQINGVMDCITTADAAKIYEFKCVSKLKQSHILQLAIYAYLVETSIEQNKPVSPGLDKVPRKYMLLNLLNGRYYRIGFELATLEEMVEFLIFNKYFVNDSLSDAEFMKRIKQYRAEFDL